MTMDNFTATEIDIILKKHRILFLFRVIAIVCAALALLIAIAFFLRLLSCKASGYIYLGLFP